MSSFQSPALTAALSSGPVTHFAAAGLPEAAGALGLVDLDLVAGMGLRVGAHEEAAVALDHLEVNAHGHIAEIAIADEEADLRIVRKAFGVDRAVLHFEFGAAAGIPAAQRAAVPDGLPGVAAQILEANVAEAHLGRLYRRRTGAPAAR